MKILISGAGIAGLSFLSFLRRSGQEHNVTVIDKATHWGNQGFSIGIWSNGREMLRKLGLVERFDSLAIPIRSLKICRLKDSKVLKNYDLLDFRLEFGLGDSHIKRKDLHDLLYESSGRPVVEKSKWIVGVENNKEKVGVEFNDGTKEEYDLLVGADGVHSSVRKVCFPDSKEINNGLCAWFFWSDNNVVDKYTAGEFVGPNKFAVVFNEGNRTLGALITHLDGEFDPESGRVERLKDVFGDVPIVEKLLEGKTDKEVIPTNIIEINQDEWFKNRVVLIGDAAHGFEPFAGLGGSMALEDSYVLASALYNNTDLEKSLGEYEIQRKQRVADAKVLTGYMKKWGVVRSPYTRFLIDLLSPIIPAKFFTSKYFKFMSGVPK